MISSLLPLLAVSPEVVAKARSPLDRPNIVMLFVDDLGYGDLGFTGHPTTTTPNIDRLAKNGKVLTTWYSGCPVCTGSRTALMTGRQFTRVGTPGVFGSTVDVGLPLNETTVADQARKAGYTTAMMGKWHLGQRKMFLPTARGFDHYLGIPYSDDMGAARLSPCNSSSRAAAAAEDGRIELDDLTETYGDWGFLDDAAEARAKAAADPAGLFLPLVHQEGNKTTIVEQPLDFANLADRYNDYVTGFIRDHKDDPFFLYMAFSHVHTTASNQPEKQYAGCPFQNSTRRGKFGDALAEADWLVGNAMQELEKQGLAENTLVLFASDNGPWMVQGKSAGSPGLLYGRASGYWNVGKGSTWEGGIREPAFAYWPGMIQPGTRSAEVVSSMDLLPTVSALLGVDLPEAVIDGRDMSPILFDKGASAHEFLFFYAGNHCHGPREGGPRGPAAVRNGKYKAHFCTSPGLSGCDGCTTKYYDPPLLFNLEEDPSEAYPLTSNGTEPTDPDVKSVVDGIRKALDTEMETFTFGTLVPPPPLPEEEYKGKYYYGVCCDRDKSCDCDGPPSTTLAPWAL